MEDKFYIYAIIGSFLHLGINFSNAIKRKDFKFIIFIKRNVFSYIVSTVAAIVTISVWKDIQAINVPKVGMVLTKINMNTLLALLIGYTGDNILKNMVKLFKTTVNTLSQGILNKIGLLFTIKHKSK